jgi:hypothetical protein
MSQEKTYRLVRFYADEAGEKVLAEGKTYEQVIRWCRDPETSSKTASSDAARRHTTKHGVWFDGFVEEVAR